jgi:hypothetical protein
MGYNEQQQGKMIGGFKPNPPANLNSVGNQWVANPTANLNLAMKEALIGAGVGTGGQGGPYVAMQPEMLQGGSYQPAPSSGYQGGGYQPSPTSIFDGGGFQEGVSGDLDPGFGMTPQAPRQEYFGPTNWNPGIGNAPHIPVNAQMADYDKRVQQVLSEGPLLTGHPSAGVTYPAAKKQAPAKKEDTKWVDDIINWEGHPSAGVTYPDPVVGGPESIDTRIEGSVDQSMLSPEEVYGSVDQIHAPNFGSSAWPIDKPYHTPLIPAGRSLDLPYGDPVFTSKGHEAPLEVDPGLLAATNAPVFEGDDYRVQDKQGTFEDFIHGGPSIADVDHLPLMAQALAQATGGRGGNVGIDRYRPEIDLGEQYDRTASSRLGGVHRLDIADPQGTLPAPWPIGDATKQQAILDANFKGSAPLSIFEEAVRSGKEALAAKAEADAEEAAKAAMLDRQGTLNAPWPREETKYQPTILGDFPYPYRR